MLNGAERRVVFFLLMPEQHERRAKFGVQLVCAIAHDRKPTALCGAIFVVLKDQGTDANAVLHEAEHELHEHFEIRHITLQLESPAYAELCGLRAGSGCC